jgi:hypothetical protein
MIVARDIVLWLPPKFHADVIGSRDDFGWITQPAWCDLDFEVDARGPFDHLNHFTHQETREAPPAGK